MRLLRGSDLTYPRPKTTETDGEEQEEKIDKKTNIETRYIVS